jgi:hypothetical protein
MKPTLTWKDGYAQGLPDGLTAYIPPAADLEGRPLLIQWHVSDITSFGAYGSHYASVEAAQRACEVALWRLGVLPLPEVQSLTEFGVSIRRAVAAMPWHSSLGVPNGGFVADGDAKRAAEVVLTALIADAIEQEADND